MNTSVPNFLYIGPDKAGSTWLHETLVRHPDVYLSPAKDLYFFDRYFERGTEWYAKHFEGSGASQIVGEVCQDYLAHPHAPARIHATLDSPKLMVTLRDPAKRAFSSYLYMRKHGEGPSTFSEALRTKPKLLDHGRYGTQLRRYLEQFSADSLHIALFDDLQEDPQALINDVTKFLGVSHLALPKSDLERKLPASRARFVPAAWLARQAANVVRALDKPRLVGRVKRSPVVHRVLYTPLDADEIRLNPADELWIREQLRTEIETVDEDFGTHLIARWGW